MCSHIVSVRFCFLDTFMRSRKYFTWKWWLKAHVCKVCVCNRYLSFAIKRCFNDEAAVTPKSQKVNKTSPVCDLGLSEQPLLTNPMRHLECLGLFCEWEFNHHIINGLGVRPVIHDTVLYSFARNLCAEMRRVVGIFYGAISWPEGAFD